MTMHLVNLAQSSKSIFEFIFVPVITGFLLKTLGRALRVGGGDCEEPCLPGYRSEIWKVAPVWQRVRVGNDIPRTQVLVADLLYRPPLLQSGIKLKFGAIHPGSGG